MLMLFAGYVGLIRGGGNRGQQQRVGRWLVATRQIGRFAGGAGHPAVQTVQRLGHSFPGQCAHIYRLGLLEEFSDISCGNCVVLQARFKPFKPESCQH